MAAGRTGKEDGNGFGQRLLGADRKQVLASTPRQGCSPLCNPIHLISNHQCNVHPACSCDYLLPPLAADFFSLTSAQAMLCDVIPRWLQWHDEVRRIMWGVQQRS